MSQQIFSVIPFATTCKSGTKPSSSLLKEGSKNKSFCCLFLMLFLVNELISPCFNKISPTNSLCPVCPSVLLSRKKITLQEVATCITMPVSITPYTSVLKWLIASDDHDLRSRGHASKIGK